MYNISKVIMAETFLAMSFVALIGNYLSNDKKLIKNTSTLEGGSSSPSKGGQVNVQVNGAPGTSNQNTPPPHNNATPYFGSSVTQNVDPMRGTESLELFTGIQPTYRNKTEVENMFQPQSGLTNIHGAPAVSSQTQDRYVPTMEKRYILPSEQIRVGPGLNVGTDVASSGGFHEKTRLRPNLVNEHLINQLPGNINAGVSRIANSSRAENIKMESDPRNNDFIQYRETVPSGASVRQQTARGQYNIMKSDNSYSVPVGIAGGAGRSEAPRDRNSQYTTNNTDREWCFDSDRGHLGGSENRAQNRMGYTSHSTDREQTSMDYSNNLRNVSSSQSNAVVLTHDGATRSQMGTSREQMGGVDPTNTFATGVNLGSTYYQNKLDSTLREHTGQNDGAHLRGAFNSNGNIDNNPTQNIQMNTTSRETTAREYAGGAMSRDVKPMSYDDILKSEGFSLRSVTDEARQPSTLKINGNPTGGRDITQVELKPNTEHTVHNLAQRQNRFNNVENIAEPEIDPNRIEVLNNRVESIMNDIPNQLNNNPYVIPMSVGNR
tara:strand:+ start:2827 stop:4470 length:1644 start_codon:yes stop_codon:yes gene_type:complete